MTGIVNYFTFKQPMRLYRPMTSIEQSERQIFLDTYTNEGFYIYTTNTCTGQRMWVQDDMLQGNRNEAISGYDNVIHSIIFIDKNQVDVKKAIQLETNKRANYSLYIKWIMQTLHKFISVQTYMWEWSSGEYERDENIKAMIIIFRCFPYSAQK